MSDAVSHTSVAEYAGELAAAIEASMPVTLPADFVSVFCRHARRLGGEGYEDLGPLVWLECLDEVVLARIAEAIGLLDQNDQGVIFNPQAGTDESWPLLQRTLASLGHEPLVETWLEQRGASAGLEEPADGGLAAVLQMLRQRYSIESAVADDQVSIDAERVIDRIRHRITRRKKRDETSPLQESEKSSPTFTERQTAAALKEFFTPLSAQELFLFQRHFLDDERLEDVAADLQLSKATAYRKRAELADRFRSFAQNNL